MSSSSTKRLVLIDNLDKGFTLYRFPTLGFVRHFSIVPSLPYFILKQAAFAESDALVVAGSDNGKVYVLDLPSARIVQVLSHGRSELILPGHLQHLIYSLSARDPVQAVAAFSYENQHLIISGSSGSNPEIYVYSRPLVRAILLHDS